MAVRKSSGAAPARTVRGLEQWRPGRLPGPAGHSALRPPAPGGNAPGQLSWRVATLEGRESAAGADPMDAEVVMVLLALMQENAAVLDVDANCAAVDAAAGKAAAAGARLLLTPELFPVGYAPLRLRAELDPAVLPALRGALAEIARRNGIALVYSLPAVSAAGEWHITATLIDENGDELLNYAKVHLFGPEERQAFAPAGASPGVVDFHGVRISLVICYDVEFPEAVRAAAVRGAELLLVPTALAEGFDTVPQLLIRARALENHLTVAYANHSGTEDGCDFLGGSVIAAPDGRLLATAGTGPGLLFAELPEPDRTGHEVAYLEDLRPEIYRSWGN